MYIIAYVQGSETCGLGHITRTAAVAKALVVRGVKLSIVCDGDDLAFRHLIARDFKAITLYEATSAGVADAWIVDAVDIPEPVVAAMRLCKRIVLLSPVCKVGDVATEAYLRIPFVGFLPFQPHVGRQWSVVELDDAPVKKQSDGQSVSLAVALSGGKNLHIQSILETILSSDRLCYHMQNLYIATSGWGFSYFNLLDKYKNISNTLLIRSSNIWKFIDDVDIFVCGDGVILDEACARGIPTVVYTTPDRMGKIEELVTSEAVLFAFEPNELLKILLQLCNSIDLRVNLSKRASCIIDKQGAERIAAMIDEL